MRIDDPRSLAWKLFAELDDTAETLGATYDDVLGAAAVVVATYVLRMRAELRDRGFGDCDLAAGDRAAWRIFRERAQELIDGGTVH